MYVLCVVSIYWSLSLPRRHPSHIDTHTTQRHVHKHFSAAFSLCWHKSFAGSVAPVSIGPSSCPGHQLPLSPFLIAILSWQLLCLVLVSKCMGGMSWNRFRISYRLHLDGMCKASDDSENVCSAKSSGFSAHANWNSYSFRWARGRGRKRGNVWSFQNWFLFVKSSREIPWELKRI